MWKVYTHCVFSVCFVEQILDRRRFLSLIWKRMRDQRGNNFTFLSEYSDLWDDSQTDKHLWAETQHTPSLVSPSSVTPPSRSMNCQIDLCSATRNGLLPFNTTGMMFIVRCGLLICVHQTISGANWSNAQCVHAKTLIAWHMVMAGTI